MNRPGDEAVEPDLMQARVQYEVPGLDVDSLAESPLAQFAAWIHDAGLAGVPEPNAMSLATCGPDGPAVRAVLAKAVSADGVRFFTNLESDKAVEIAHDPRVSVVFAWITQHRQIRFSGPAELLPRAECAEYFASRPRGAQIGAWASAQSRPIGTRAQLQDQVAAVEQRYPEGTEVPLPDFWGGYLIRPTAVEFWQGQPSRLHDRFRFLATVAQPSLAVAEHWSVTRLSP